VALALNAQGGGAGPWFYTVDAGKTVADRLPADTARTLHGPNGFLRAFPNPLPPLVVMSTLDRSGDSLMLILRNQGDAAMHVTVTSPTYGASPPRHLTVTPHSTVRDRWPIAAADHWYDLDVRVGDAVWRLAGHCETGRSSRCDPAIGRV
jgi:phospholipase C